MLTEEIGRRPKSNFYESRNAVRQGLVTGLQELRELLGSHPRADLARIRGVLHEVRSLHQASAIGHGLLALVLHNMVRDLAGTAGQFETNYYARQLSVVIEQLLSA